MGRKKVSNEDRKDRGCCTRFTDKEYNEIIKIIKLLDVNSSQFLHMCVIKWIETNLGIKISE